MIECWYVTYVSDFRHRLDKWNGAFDNKEAALRHAKIAAEKHPKYRFAVEGFYREGANLGWSFPFTQPDDMGVSTAPGAIEPAEWVGGSEEMAA